MGCLVLSGSGLLLYGYLLAWVSWQSCSWCFLVLKEKEQEVKFTEIREDPHTLDTLIWMDVIDKVAVLMHPYNIYVWEGYNLRTTPIWKKTNYIRGLRQLYNEKYSNWVNTTLNRLDQSILAFSLLQDIWAVLKKSRVKMDMGNRT